jgi:hypothetical protein
MSGSIFKVTTAMFALQAITSLLTQSGIARLATERGLTAGLLIKATADSKAKIATGLFSGGIKKLLPNLLKFGGMIARFLGPIGIAAGITTLLVAGFKKYNKIQEDARRKVLAFGNALTTSKKQAESTGQYFGVSVQKSNLEKDISSQMGSGRYNVELRKKLDEFQASDTFKKEYEQTVKDLKVLSDSEAKTALLVRMQNLVGQGYSEEQIQIIISSLQEAAGKTAIDLNFKDININTLNKQVLDGLQPELAKLAKFDGGKGLTGSIRTTYNKETGITTETIYQTKQFSLAIENAGLAIKSVLTNLSLLQSQGKISTKDLQQAFNGLMYNIQNSTSDSATKVALFNKALEGMDNPIAKAAILTDDLTKKTKLMNAAMLGAIIPTAMLNAYLFGGSGLYSEGTLSVEIDKIIAKAGQLNDKFKKAMDKTVNPFENVGVPQTSVEKANKQLSVIQNYFSAKEELIRQDRQLEEDALQASIDATQKRIDAEQQLIDTNQRSIDLLSRRIDLEYDRPIQKLQDESAILGNTLTLIREQEDAINKQYDSQVKALEKISSINQEIAGQEKSRLTIADALTSGDIAAAAAAVQDARAQAAASRIDQQTKALEVSRQQALTGITAGGMTKDQIEARTYAIGQQVFSLEQQRKTLQDQIVVLQDKNYATEQNIYKIKEDSLIPQQKALETYQKSTTSLIEGQLVLGKTQKEWVIAEGKVNLYNAALDLSNEKLSGMDKLLTSIAKKSSSLQTNLENKGTIGALSITPTTFATGVGQSKITTPFDTGSAIKRSLGGMVPRYMALGGKVGSDTVPAMLTPGEFVVNRQAAKSFGPLLSMLNESKYPSMIGSSYAGQGGSGSNITSVSDNSSSVYNYNVGITVPQSNANPNDIARAVIGQIKYIDNQRIRGQK